MKRSSGLVAVLLFCACMIFSLAFYTLLPGGTINDEAVELLQARDIPTGRFCFFAPNYQGGFVDLVESLVPYVNHFLACVLGDNPIFIRIFYALCYWGACLAFFLLLRDCFRSEGFALLGALLLGGSAYAIFFSRVLSRNGISMLWTTLMMWLAAGIIEGPAGGRKPLRRSLLLSLVVVLAIMTYTSFKFAIPALYLALLVWGLSRTGRGKITYVAISLLAACGIVFVLLALSHTPVYNALFRGSYVLGGGFSPQKYMRYLAYSFLTPVYYMRGGDFLVEVMHSAYNRQTLSPVLVPFFILGVLNIVWAWRLRFGFPQVMALFWAFSVALLAAGGPNIKYHYALFPVVVFISLCGMKWAYDAAGAVLPRKLVACGGALVIAVFFAGEIRHLFWVIPTDGLFILDISIPRLVADAAAACAPDNEKVYIVEGWGRDAVRYLTRAEPKVRYLGPREGEIPAEMASDLSNKRPFAIVTEGDRLPAFLSGYRNTESAFGRKTWRGPRTTVTAFIFRAGAGPLEKRVAPPRGASVARLLLGGHGGDAGQYNEPRGIAVDEKGTVYVADFRNYRIQQFKNGDAFAAAWGGEGNAPGQFRDPCDVAVGGDGRVYVADTFNHRIQVLGPDGRFLYAHEGGLFAPRGLAVDGKGRVWVADTGNGAVKLYAGKDSPPRLIGGRGKGNGEFDNPIGIAVDSRGRVYVADTGNTRVQILDAEGTYLSQFKVKGWKPGVFTEPYLDVDSRGDIYLTDPPGNRVLKYSARGKLLGVWKPAGGGAEPLSSPMGIAVQKNGGVVYVVDCGHHRIVKASKKDFR